MEGVVLVLILAGVFAVPFTALVLLIRKATAEECPEREPDLSDEERAVLDTYFKTNKWEAS